MILADMIASDEDALICDLAECYSIFDYKSLPVKTVATLSVGLRNNSRIKLKINGEKYPFETMLLAAITDRLSFIAWTKTEDARSGINRPESIIEKLVSDPEETTDDDIAVFDSIEAFEEARRQYLKDLNNG